MRKISLWRYLAVNRKTLFAVLACALLMVTMLGCGASNHLKSIQLNAALINGVAPASQTGFVTLQGNGGTIQLQAIGTYGGGTTKDLTKVAVYTVIVDPQYTMDAYGNTLLPPCQAPSCPVPSAPPYTSGTVEYNATGLITAVEPATCTWVDVGPSGTPSFFYTGDYEVTVTFDGITSQPVFIPIASSAGDQYYNGAENNPTAQCGPSPSS